MKRSLKKLILVSLIPTILLLAYCGMRRGELMGLEFKDIDFENNTLEIVRTSNYQNGTTGIYTSTPKTKSSVRELYLQPHLTEMIRQWYDEQQMNAGTMNSR